MSFFQSARECVKSLIDRVPGLKCLILDQQTTGIVSLVLSQSAILEKEVYLVSRIDSSQVLSEEETVPNLKHLKVLFFIRPSTDNILRLAKELKSPKFGQYFIFFSNTVTSLQLQRLARADEFEVVQRVEVFYVDIFPLYHSLFSLNVPSTSCLTKETHTWTAYEEAIFVRVVDGLLSSCLLLRMAPVVRYTANSPICRKLSSQLALRLGEAQLPGAVLSGFHHVKPETLSSHVVLIVDRRDDPVTPLLAQWTYQAMVHELLSIENNVVQLPNQAVGASASSSGGPKEVIMDAVADSFYEENLYANFGDLAVAVNDYVRAYQQQHKTSESLDTVDDMQRFVDKYEEFRSLSSNVSKHVAVLHELSRIVSINKLFDVSSLEQDLACVEGRAEHHRQVLQKCREPSTGNMERLRLVLLYALRYENAPDVMQLKSELLKHGVSSGQVDLVDALLSYAGSAARSGDLFSNKNLLSIARNVVKRHIKGVENIYTQHRTLLYSTVELLLQGRLKEATHPTLAVNTIAGRPGRNGPLPSGNEAQDRPANSSDKPTTVLVFVMGGASYEEARDMNELSKLYKGVRIFLGGSAMHNTNSFLADVAQFSTASHQHSGGELQPPQSVERIGVFSGALR